MWIPNCIQFIKISYSLDVLGRQLVLIRHPVRQSRDKNIFCKVALPLDKESNVSLVCYGKVKRYSMVWYGMVWYMV